MRKGHDGGETGKKKRLMKIAATMSLPAVDRPNADHWNAARSCQKEPQYNGVGTSFLKRFGKQEPIIQSS